MSYSAYRHRVFGDGTLVVAERNTDMYVIILDDIEYPARMVRKEVRDGKTVTILTLVPPKEENK